MADIVPPPLTENELREISELEGTGAPPAPTEETLPPVPVAAAENEMAMPSIVEPPTTTPSPTPVAEPAEKPLLEPLPVEPPKVPATDFDELSKLESETKPPPPPENAGSASENSAQVEPPSTEKSSAKSFDQELDSGSSPQPQENEVHDAIEDAGEPNVVVEEMPIFDPFINSLSFAFGFYRVAANGNIHNPAVGGIRFGKTIGNNILVRKATLQDSFAIEGGLFFYKALNLGSDQQDDSYFVAPLVVTGRYNLLLSDIFGLFVYAGLQKGFVLSAIPGSTSAENAPIVLSDLNALGPALGMGLFFQVGPNWDFRADIGYETIGLGLMLRF